ncbi:MAG: transcriptional regulator NrdR [bacterium]|nr:transcriptional regulator NrdR [bacterium]
MRCPRCQNLEDRVLDSRTVRDGQAIRRRRECIQCNKRFTTYEYIEPEEHKVRKRDGRLELYSREKLLKSIRIAFAKRPFHLDQLEQIVNQIENEIFVGENEISSSKIGELVMSIISKIDEVAYIRFASVYKRFQETGDFRSEISILRKENS